MEEAAPPGVAEGVGGVGSGWALGVSSCASGGCFCGCLSAVAGLADGGEVVGVIGAALSYRLDVVDFVGFAEASG